LTDSPGHDDDFHDFVVARYSSLVALGYLLMRDRAHAEDLVQSALIRTYNSWRRIREPANAEAYTRKVMVRLATRWSRRRWVGEVPSGLVGPAASTDPWSHVELASAMNQALLGLPIRQRAVLVLRFYEDLTEAQTADLLGCSVGTVKSRSSRALAALRAAGLLDREGERFGSEVPDHG
jgi:RNA polymerase sigma-70 factor (sigma-E family)